jgi:hypothetical protein
MRNKLLESLVEEIVKSEIEEMAMQPAQAAEAGVALLESEDGEEFVLFDAGEAYKHVQQLATQGFTKSGNLITIIKPIVDLIRIVGAIGITEKPECKAFYVSYVVAEKGYGPMLYDIAMSKANDKGMGLMPDRGIVRPGARGVWKNYMYNRADVKKIGMEDQKCDIKFRATDDKEETALNARYYLQNKPNIQALEKSFGGLEQSIQGLLSKTYKGWDAEIQDAMETFKKMIILQAQSIFQSKFHGV